MDNQTDALLLPDELVAAPVLEQQLAVREVQQEQAQIVLKPEEATAVANLAQKIDIENSVSILQYGAAAQGKMTGFADSALSSVRNKDLGEVGKMVTDLVVELKGFNPNEDKGITGFFKKMGNSTVRLKAKYDEVTVNIDKIVQVLNGHKLNLLKDVAMLDKMYTLDLQYCKELFMYILAGKQKLEETRNGKLAQLVARARETNNQEDINAAKNLTDMCDRFEKRLYDLELTRIIAIQMAPQIRLVQENDSVMIDKIQSSISNTIPLWKNQMVLALGLSHTRAAIEAQREVNDITNKMLLQNAQTLKQNAIASAKESERGIVEVETLTKTNEELITTLDEVVRIHTEGRQRRQEAEKELVRIETDLKNKMLEISGRSNPAS